MPCEIKHLHRLSFIVWGSVSFIGLGVALSILGPTLLDLAARVTVDVTAISSLITVRAVGAVTGSVLSGILLDKFTHYSYALTAITILISIVTLCIVPYSVHLAMMGAFILICGLSLGALDNECNTLLLRLWKTGSGPSMQLLHFAFGLGAVLAPLLAEPFISSIAEPLVTNMNCSQINTTIGLDSFDSSCLQQLFNDSCTDHPDSHHSSHSNQTFSASNCTVPATQSASLRYAYAYLLGALTFVPPLIAFAYHSIRAEFGHCYRRDSLDGSAAPGVHTDHHLVKKPHLLFKIVFFPSLFFFIYLYCGMETSYGNFIFTFAVESLNFTKQKAAFLNAVFWGCFTVGRFAAIFIACTKVPSSVVIAVDTVGSTLSLLVMTVLSHNDVVVWVGTATLGAFMASIYPTAMFWLSEQVEVSGKAVAVITTGATLGDMTLPLTVAALTTQLSHSALIPFELVGTALYTLVGGLLMLIAFVERRRQRRTSSVGVVAYDVLKDSDPADTELVGGSDLDPSSSDPAPEDENAFVSEQTMAPPESGQTGSSQPSSAASDGGTPPPQAVKAVNAHSFVSSTE